MNFKNTLLLTCFTVGIAVSTDAQIWNATQPEIGIWSAPNNTGLAIAPDEDIQAAVFDDPGGFYQIYWIEGSTSTIVDADANSGIDPDVAYYANADALVVAYEDGGVIFVDDYYLATLLPTPDYFMNTTTAVSSGTYPNVDMNSMGDGVLCWEDGGMIWACSFGIGAFNPGPPTPVIDGTQPDIILLDDGSTVALTYVDPNGSLHIMTLDYGSLQGGGAAIMQLQGFDWLGNTAAFPRIAGQRNSNFGAPDDFTVVAQYSNSPTFPEVYGVFSTGGTISAAPVLINGAFAGCNSSDPRPVVAYDRSEVHVAWSQNYFSGCSGLGQSNPNFTSDVLLTNYDPVGNLLPATPPIPGGFIYEEVNQFQSFIGGNSRTSISTEYDGFFSINNFNYHEGVLFNDPGDLLWKERSAAVPVFMEQQISGERGNNFSLVTSPVD
ncbi:MAG: hypothetical protein AB8B56_06940, partial [Crocinitomicaceae bacterium]